MKQYPEDWSDIPGPVPPPGPPGHSSYERDYVSPITPRSPEPEEDHDQEGEEVAEIRKFQVGDKVRIESKSVMSIYWKKVLEVFEDRIGYVVKIKGNPYKKSNFFNNIIVGRSPDSPEKECYTFAYRDLELVEQSTKPIDNSEPPKPSELSESRKAKKQERKIINSKTKTLVKTASELIQTIEKTFKNSETYPIFGIKLSSLEPEVKNSKPNLDESLLSLGVVLYHLYTGQSEHNNHSYLLDGYSKPEDMPEEPWKVVNKLLGSEYKDLNELKKNLKRCGR